MRGINIEKLHETEITYDGEENTILTHEEARQIYGYQSQRQCAANIEQLKGNNNFSSHRSPFIPNLRRIVEHPRIPLVRTPVEFWGAQEQA